MPPALASIELAGLLSHKRTPCNKLPWPTSAAVTWSCGRCDALALEWLNSGAGRDVFASEGAPYILKLQGAQWHEESNLREAMLARTGFREFLPQVHGAVLAQFHGQEVRSRCLPTTSSSRLSPSSFHAPPPLRFLLMLFRLLLPRCLRCSWSASSIHSAAGSRR